MIVAAHVRIAGAVLGAPAVVPLLPGLVLAQASRAAVGVVPRPRQVRLLRRADQLLAVEVPLALLGVFGQVDAEGRARGVRAGARVAQHQQPHLLVDRVVVVGGGCRGYGVSADGRGVHVGDVVGVV